MSERSGIPAGDPIGGRQPTGHERRSGLPWDASYRDGPAPWDIGAPQPAVVRMASEGRFAGTVLDAGCGTGDNALHVASLGLSVLGVDVAETALAIARAKADDRRIAVEFAAADAFQSCGRPSFPTVAGRSPPSNRTGCPRGSTASAPPPRSRPSRGSRSRDGYAAGAVTRGTRLEAKVGELHGIARFTFHPGKLDEFKRLSAQCMEIVRTKDTGTLQYGIYFNDDESECIVHEHYRDSEALIEHAAHLGGLTEAILATGSVSGELLGDPSAELRASLTDGPVRLFRPFLSM